MYKSTLIAATLVALSLSLSASPSRAEKMNASWYGPGFHGKTMANGEKFNMYANTVAIKSHKWKLGTRICITSSVNGKKAKAHVTDRGPFIAGRQIDLSFALGKQMGIIPNGTGEVDVVRC
jgi:rare lipoprotein A